MLCGGDRRAVTPVVARNRRNWAAHEIAGEFPLFRGIPLSFIGGSGVIAPAQQRPSGSQAHGQDLRSWRFREVLSGKGLAEQVDPPRCALGEP